MKTDIITISADVNCPRDQVWSLWTEPEHVTRWNFASDDWCCPSAENDLRVGGRYKARMEAKDGSFGFDFEAIYEEVSKPEKMVYTLEDGRKVSTTFEEKDGATTVTTEFDAEAENSVEMQRSGWQAILNNFKAYAESQR